MVQGVILDIDGTLIDSNDAHARAWVDALNEAGRPVPYERIRELIGMGGDNLLPEATGLQKDEEPGKSISKRRGEIFKARYFPTLKPFPQVRDLVQHLKDRGLKLVVATSAEKDEAEKLLELAGVKELLGDQIATSADADSSKPDPDIVLAALKKLDIAPNQAIMLGDTPYDIESAGKAGVRTIGVRSGGWSELPGAIAVYDDPAHLLASIEQSPLGRRA